jgi:hypothetical protein
VDVVEFQQATIPVQNEPEFYALREAIERVFSPAQIHNYLRGLKRAGVKVRQFEQVLEKELIERADAELARSGRKARELYETIAMSDKAQMREFYLVRLEKVGDEIREKFASAYRDY